MSHEDKYLKYKKKYLALKMKGGTFEETINKKLEEILENQKRVEEKNDENFVQVLEEVQKQGIQMRADMAAATYRR
jgi:hypothetical protein